MSKAIFPDVILEAVGRVHPLVGDKPQVIFCGWSGPVRINNCFVNSSFEEEILKYLSYLTRGEDYTIGSDAVTFASEDEAFACWLKFSGTRPLGPTRFQMSLIPGLR